MNDHIKKIISQTVDYEQYDSLVALVEESERLFPEKIAFSNHGCSMSYADVRRLSECLATFLINEAQFVHGDRLLVFLPNLMQFPITVFGGLKAGGIIVPINPLYTAHELTNVLKDSQPKVMVILENFLHLLDEIPPEYLPKTIITTQVGDALGWLKGTFYNVYIRYIKKMIPSYQSGKNYKEWGACLKKGSAQPYQKIALQRSDIAFLQYTGGTTGKSKAAMLSHKNMVANILQAAAWIKGFYPDCDTYTICTPLPMYHIFSLTANMLTFFHFGAKNLLITNPKDIDHFIALWKNEPFDAITGVNTLYKAFLQHPSVHSLPFDRLKVALGGGMPVQPKVAEDWQKLSGKPIIEAYGLTEASPAVCMNALNSTAFSGTVGYPIPETQIKIISETNEALPPGQVGELCIKGPQVMVGYWNEPEETKLVLTPDGWLKTGDLAVVTSEGMIKIMDRKKDLIIVSGFNVYPNEVEEILGQHEAIKECAITSLIDRDGNEQVKAFIVLREGYLFDQKLINAFLRKKLTAYKIPKHYEIVSEIPKSNVGKILKRELRPA